MPRSSNHLRTGLKRLGGRERYTRVSMPLDQAKTVHHSRWTDYLLRQFDDEEWRAATNEANNSQDATRVTIATRPDPYLKTQQPYKPLPPPKPPPPQPWRPRPGTATEKRAQQRAVNYHQSDFASPYTKRQPRQGARGGTTPGGAPNEQQKEQKLLGQCTLSGLGPRSHSSGWDSNIHGNYSASHQSEESSGAAKPSA